MEVFRGTKAITRLIRNPVVAIGNFDGVHVGHKTLLDLARKAASARGGEAVVLTFEPHPAKVLAPALAPPLITTLARKLELLAALGVDACVVEPFSPALAAKQAPEFVQTVLVAALHAREVVVGHDFTYGHKRRGNVSSLGAAGIANGFQVHVVPAVTVDGLVASSTKIREFVHEGNVEGAALLLGRRFDVEGNVIRGAGRGKTLGIPTANLETTSELMPKAGVYAAYASLKSGARHAAVVNLGTNPTFTSSGRLSLEAHLLDFAGDLYEQIVRVEFQSRLRSEERFPSVEVLLSQIRRDIALARTRLFRPLEKTER